MINKILKTIFEESGKIRDFILFILSIDYAIGYFVWAYFAWKYNLGAISLFDSQYLIAGCPIIFAIIIYVLIILIILKLTLLWWPNIYDNFSFKTQNTLSIIITLVDIIYFVMLLALLIKVYFLDYSNKNVVFPMLAFGMLLTVIRSPAIYSVNYFKMLFKGTNFIKKLNKAKYEKIIWNDLKDRISTLIIYPTIIFFIYINLFISIYFQKIPQEFGGAKIKYAIFDLDKRLFSKTTLEQLVERHTRIDEIQVSKILPVYHYNSNSLFIGLSDSTNDKIKIIEISKSNINAIHWINNNKRNVFPNSTRYIE